MVRDRCSFSLGNWDFHFISIHLKMPLRISFHSPGSWSRKGSWPFHLVLFFLVLCTPDSVPSALWFLLLLFFLIASTEILEHFRTFIFHETMQTLVLLSALSPSPGFASVSLWLIKSTFIVLPHTLCVGRVHVCGALQKGMTKPWPSTNGKKINRKRVRDADKQRSAQTEFIPLLWQQWNF